jgi:excisionase family DNA binding protein
MAKMAYLNQAAIELGLTEYQLRRMAKEHKIPFLMSGSRYVFNIELAEEYLMNKAMENVTQEEQKKQYGVLRKVEG